MSKDIVGVVGAGTMGAGIAQVALEAGHEVVLHDVDEAAIQGGRARIREGLARRAAKLDLDADSIDEWVEGRLAGLRDGHSLDAVGAEAGVIVEAALEDLELKRTIFHALDAAASPDAILATNTSALSVAAIAEVTEHPDRVVGLHFFNPAPVMRLVEVVSAPATSPAIASRAAALVTSWDRVPVAVADSPGFIVNRVNRPFTLEALAAFERGEAGVVEIDEAVRAAGYPMGPFELMDLVGVDVNLAAARGVWEGFGRAARFRPSPTQERLVEEERLGRKSGRGFYRYDGGSRAGVDVDSDATSGSAAATIASAIELAVIAEAWRALGDGIATADDIDLAIRLGTGHRIGPFERTAELGGPAAVANALEAYAARGPRFEVPAGLRDATAHD
ncbi:MAG TPA: 3-hydroxyacyl-CoA dehydrogenase NAD-binding domain-containing protein [Candidatus Limnocylindrales bacterium]|nr:3-hydroxyacyl-CoA dehydrogenase NAD-binding domain-containing protein [Candidatus Limnocylindrales bacterium]